MPVRQTQSVMRCNVCKHPNRARIDDLLLLRSNREVNKAQFGELLVALEGTNLSPDSLKNHWRKHCETLTSTQEADARAAGEALVGGLKERVSRGETVSPDDVLDAILMGGMAELEMKLERDGSLGITVDQLLKAVAEKTKRRQNESQAKLLDALGAGIGQVFQKALGPPPTTVEGQIVREIEDSDSGS